VLPSAYLPSLGGVEEATRHLALALRAAGDDVEVWTGTEDATSYPTSQVHDGITVRRFPMPLPAAHPSAMVQFLPGAWRTVRAMRKSLRSFRPDVLHVSCFGPNGVYGVFLGRTAGVPVVITLHGETLMDDHDIFEHSAVMRSCLRVGLRSAAAVTACSRFTLLDAERRFGLAQGRGQVLFNGVAAEEGATVPPSAPGGLSEGRLYVLALGRVVEKKGFDLLLQAFAMLADRHPDVALVVGGDGRAMPALRTLVDELQLGSRVVLSGRLSRTEVAAAMGAAQLIVVPSRLEPFGLVVLEGWRAGVPVVVTNRGGPPEFVHDGEDGILVDPLDVRALAGAIDRLLGDPKERQRIGAAGRNRVAEFAWDRVAEQYRLVYRSVLAVDACGKQE